MTNSPYYTIQNYNFKHYNRYFIEIDNKFSKGGKEIVKKVVIIKKSDDVPTSKEISFTNKQFPDKIDSFVVLLCRRS